MPTAKWFARGIRHGFGNSEGSHSSLNRKAPHAVYSARGWASRFHRPPASSRDLRQRRFFSASRAPLVRPLN
jgi:hypothetical protein